MEESPAKVSLKDLVAASKGAPEPPPVRTKTPAGLPVGMQWVAHDTGKMGFAAARLRAAIQTVLDSPAQMGSEDIDTLLGALEQQG